EELLIRLSKKNYISDKVQKEYGRAFVREFRKFLGQPVGDESPEGLEIKVLGAGCVLCNSLENEVMEVLSEIGLSADLEHVRDVEQIAKYSVKGTPALIINGKVMCSGRIPSKNMIRKWLEKTGVYEDSGGAMTKPVLIKNILFSEPHNLDELVAYESGRVVSRTFSQNSSLSITLFSFDEGEGLSRHTAPGDAMVQILDGEAVVNIDGKEMTVGKGQVVVMPADIPHSVTAVKRFKMLLTLVKRPQNSSSK
ncbi:MAG: thioredoxin family protein, partial [Deltaproteobacteria bacterium]|nr:thioredoxin family protein [Deltaproteobacteria bacterium]